MDKLIFHYGPGGSLVCNKEIPGITQLIDGETAAYYGDAYFVAETMSRKTAEEIVKLFGGELSPNDVDPKF